MKSFGKKKNGMIHTVIETPTGFKGRIKKVKGVEKKIGQTNDTAQEIIDSIL